MAVAAGRAAAEQLAFLAVEPADYFRLPPQVLVYEKVRQELFPGGPTADQDAAAWDAVGGVCGLMWDGRLSKTAALQLAFAWRGSEGSFGWGGVAPGLPPGVRGPVAFVMGRRYLVLNRPGDARRLFQTAAADAPADSPLRRLAEAELRR